MVDFFREIIPADITALVGRMVIAVLFGLIHINEQSSQIICIDRCTNLVINHTDSIMRLANIQHSLDKVLTVQTQHPNLDHFLHTKQRIGSSRPPLSSFPHTDPSFLITTITVFSNIFISNPIFQLEIYSRSNLTTSSKSVISLLPLTCHNPVIPGFIASRAR